MATEAQLKHDLLQSIVIPSIRGEMVHLHPATAENLPRLGELNVFHGTSKITDKDMVIERAIVHTWVRRSQARETSQAPAEPGVSDPESHRTITWVVLADVDHDDDGRPDAASVDNAVGVTFLIDIGGWSKSACIQIILGHEYRGRGYSHDAMLRVVTYGFTPEPASLDMCRVWVSVPEKNNRPVPVYQSLGFMSSGTSRDAPWNAENSKYQDLIVMDTLADEYDPTCSSDVFGMHLTEDDPGAKEALSVREHSIATQQNESESEPAQRGKVAAATTSDVQSQAQTSVAAQSAEPQAEHHDGTQKNTCRSLGEGNNWPYGQAERESSKETWQRALGRDCKRDTESE